MPSRKPKGNARNKNKTCGVQESDTRGSSRQVERRSFSSGFPPGVFTACFASLRLAFIFSTGTECRMRRAVRTHIRGLAARARGTCIRKSFGTRDPIDEEKRPCKANDRGELEFSEGRCGAFPLVLWPSKPSAAVKTSRTTRRGLFWFPRDRFPSARTRRHGGDKTPQLWSLSSSRNLGSTGTRSRNCLPSSRSARLFQESRLWASLGRCPSPAAVAADLFEGTTAKGGRQTRKYGPRLYTHGSTATPVQGSLCSVDPAGLSRVKVRCRREAFRRARRSRQEW